MKRLRKADSPEHTERSPLGRMVIPACVVLALVAICWPRRHQQSKTVLSGTALSKLVLHSSDLSPARESSRGGSAPLPPLSPEEIVATKVKQFGRIRRETVAAIAR